MSRCKSGSARAPAISLLVAGLLLAGCTAPDPAQYDSIPLPVRERLDTAVEHGHRVGVVVGFVNPRGRHFHAAGMTEAGGAKSMRPSSIIGIGSLTKLFTAELLADAVVSGELQLETPVRSLLHIDDAADTRLWQLATHRAGLPRALSPSDLAESDPHALYANLSKQRSLPAEPAYSNLGYALLGEAVSVSAELPLAELLARRITAPLGLDATGYAPDPARLAAPHQGRTRVSPPQVPVIARGAGGLYSNAEDLLAFVEHKLAPDSARARARNALLTGIGLPESIRANGVESMGWKRHHQGELEVFHHGGDGNGYQAFIAFRPAHRTGVVLLANSSADDALQQIALHLMDPGTPLPDFDHAPALRLSRDQLLPRVGHYGIAGDANTIELSLDAEGLRYIERDEHGERVRESRLFALSPERFELREIPVTIRFNDSDPSTTTATLSDGDQEFVLERR